MPKSSFRNIYSSQRKRKTNTALTCGMVLFPSRSAANDRNPSTNETLQLHFIHKSSAQQTKVKTTDAGQCNLSPKRLAARRRCMWSVCATRTGMFSQRKRNLRAPPSRAFQCGAPRSLLAYGVCGVRVRNASVDRRRLCAKHIAVLANRLRYD